MKQVTLVSEKTFEISEVPVPQCGPKQALLKVKAVGICGSDIHAYYGKHPFISFPVVQGHEATGEVVEVGAEVRELKVGDRVLLRPQKACGKCRMCREGRYNICKTLEVYGCQDVGASSDYYAADADLLYKLPDGTDYGVGTVIEPLAVGVGAVRRPGGVEGKNVLVIGAGTIGNVVMQSAKALGANKVIISDVSDYTLNMAKACGADVTVNVKNENLEEVLVREFGEDGIDVVFECSANGGALNQVLRCGRKGIQFVIVAVYGHKPEIEMGLIQDREYEIYGSLMYLHEDYETAIRLVAEGKVNLQALISKEYPLEQVSEAYKYIEQNRDTVQKVILNV